MRETLTSMFDDRLETALLRISEVIANRHDKHAAVVEERIRTLRIRTEG